MIKTVLQGLFVILFFVTVKGQQVSPAIGDIRLEKLPGSLYYEVLIFYTDGVNPPDWGGICAATNPRVPDVLCQQLGFKAPGHPLSGFTYTRRPVWLTNIACTGDETHILQCRYDEVTGSERSGPMICGSQGLRQLIRCDDNFGRPTAYNGEIRLCPPDSTLNKPNNDNITSVSFGVVALNIQAGGHSLWRGIIQASGGSSGLLSSDEADAICRQLGFTNAVVGSAVARSSTSYSMTSGFNANCYSQDGGSQDYTIQSQAWMTTGDVKCNSPQNCLGCCYSTPEVACENCDAQQDIVIGCTFDIRKSKNSKITGNSDKCTLNSKQCIAAGSVPDCSRERKVLRDVGGALGFLVALLFIITIILTVYIIYKRHCTYSQ